MVDRHFTDNGHTDVKEISEQKGEPGPSREVYSSNKLLRQFNKASCYDSEEEECDDSKVGGDFVGPLLPLKEQLEKDRKMRAYKYGKSNCWVVLIWTLWENAWSWMLGIKSTGHPDSTLPIPFILNSRGLKEGIHMEFYMVVYVSIP
eukprot:Gb_11017 [translate_table: standard]